MNRDELLKALGVAVDLAGVSKQLGDEDVRLLTLGMTRVHGEQPPAILKAILAAYWAGRVCTGHMEDKTP